MKRLSFILVLMMLSSSLYALTLKGKLSTDISTADDNVYVAVLWMGDDGPKSAPGFSTEVIKVKNGSYKGKIKTEPSMSSCINLNGVLISIGYVVAFKDVNNNGRFDAKDKMIGVAEKNCLTYVKGDIQKAFEYIRQHKGEMPLTLQQLQEGMHITKALTPEEHKMDTPFDDLVPVSKKTSIKISIETDNYKPRAPNWT